MRAKHLDIEEETPTMYIRQISMISFEDVMNFQEKTKIELIFSQLDLSTFVYTLTKDSDIKGPKGYKVSSLLYAILAMQLLKIKHIKTLVERLKSDPVLRYNCGFDLVGKTPSQATFSRFLDKLANTPSLEALFLAVVEKAKAIEIIDGEHISIDSTKLESYEAAQPQKNLIADGEHPNWGMKRDTHGNNIRWFGWKLHILCDSKSELPVFIKMTPANVHDSKVAIDLIDGLLSSYPTWKRPIYYAMDSGYDTKDIYKAIIHQYNGVPVIAYNPRGASGPPEGLDDDFHPICSGGYKLVYWGRDGDYLKFRCPLALGKCDCAHGMMWCSSSNYGYTLKVNLKSNPRHLSYPLRSTDQWKLLYNKRTSVERCNSRLKETLNVDAIASKGIKKAKMHALLNCIALVSASIVAKLIIMRNAEEIAA